VPWLTSSQSQALGGHVPRPQFGQQGHGIEDDGRVSRPGGHRLAAELARLWQADFVFPRKRWRCLWTVFLALLPQAREGAEEQPGFWRAKLAKNKARDAVVNRELRAGVEGGENLGT